MRPWNGIGFAVIFLALAWSIDEYANVDGITEALNVDPHQSSELDGGQAASSQVRPTARSDPLEMLTVCFLPLLLFTNV